MQNDKTLRLTEQSRSEITSFLDRKLRVSIGGSHDQLLSMPKLSFSHSLKNLSIQTSRCSNLEYENEMLKAEISNLKRLLKIQRQTRVHQNKQLENQVMRLKNLIQKSYYSLKGIENQKINLEKQLDTKREILEKEKFQAKYLQQKVNQMQNFIQNMTHNHQTEIKLIWERVAHLQKNLESVVKLIEQDRKEERKISHFRSSSYQSESEKKSRLY